MQKEQATIEWKLEQALKQVSTHYKKIILLRENLRTIIRKIGRHKTKLKQLESIIQIMQADGSAYYQEMEELIKQNIDLKAKLANKTTIATVLIWKFRGGDIVGKVPATRAYYKVDTNLWINLVLEKETIPVGQADSLFEAISKAEAHFVDAKAGLLPIGRKIL
jgi:hypothetical protein